MKTSVRGLVGTGGANRRQRARRRLKGKTPVVDRKLAPRLQASGDAIVADAERVVTRAPGGLISPGRVSGRGPAQRPAGNGDQAGRVVASESTTARYCPAHGVGMRSSCRIQKRRPPAMCAS